MDIDAGSVLDYLLALVALAHIPLHLRIEHFAEPCPTDSALLHSWRPHFIRNQRVKRVQIGCEGEQLIEESNLVMHGLLTDVAPSQLQHARVLWIACIRVSRAKQFQETVTLLLTKSVHVHVIV